MYICEKLVSLIRFVCIYSKETIHNFGSNLMYYTGSIEQKCRKMQRKIVKKEYKHCFLYISHWQDTMQTPKIYNANTQDIQCKYPGYTMQTLRLLLRASLKSILETYC